MSISTLNKQTALITGASGGIGLELARVFSSEGFNLVLVARSADKLNILADELQSAYGIKADVLVQDLSERGSAMKVYESLRERNIAVDVLVNNAGFAVYGNYLTSDTKAEADMIDLNICTLVELTKLFLKEMVERGKGRIMNVASTASFQPGPMMAVYYATKAFVLSFTEAVKEEIRNTQVTLTALCPGPTVSGFQDRANMHGIPLVSKMFLMDSRTVAVAGYKGLMKGKAVVIPGLLNKLVAFSTRLGPRWLVRRIVWMLSQKSGGAHA